jgi:hypothetical protein
MMVVSGFWKFAGLVLFGVVLNAAVCGMLSGAQDRYQARVVWLVPLLALIAASHGRTTTACLTKPKASGDAIAMP